MCFGRQLIVERHHGALELTEKADHIVGLVIEDPRNTVGIRAVKPGMRGKETELCPSLIQIRRCRLLKAGNVMAPERESAHHQRQPRVHGLCHGAVGCLAVSSPVNRELLTACRRTSCEQNRISLALFLLKSPENQLIVQMRVIIVHHNRIASVMINHVNRDPLAEIRLDGINACIQQPLHLAGIPLAGFRIRKVHQSHSRLPVVNLLDAAAILPHKEEASLYALTEHFRILCHIGIDPAAELQSLLVVSADHARNVSEHGGIPGKIAPVQRAKPVAVEVEHPHRNAALLHAADQPVRGVLIIAWLKAGRKPQSEAPCGRKGRAPGQCRVNLDDIRRGLSVHDMHPKLLAGYRSSDKADLLRADLIGNRPRVIGENTVPLTAHIKRNVLIADVACRSAVLIPEVDGLTVFHKRSKPLAKAVDVFSRLYGELGQHIRLIILFKIMRIHPKLRRLFVDAHIADVAEVRAGQASSLCFKGDRAGRPVHADRHVPRL